MLKLNVNKMAYMYITEREKMRFWSITSYYIYQLKYGDLHNYLLVSKYLEVVYVTFF